uniref:Uncharacterized protein n=1 Tax=Arundo donax TaxID=35708 RepID=A0A0A9A9Y4_ARUDO
MWAFKILLVSYLAYFNLFRTKMLCYCCCCCHICGHRGRQVR